MRKLARFLVIALLCLILLVTLAHFFLSGRGAEPSYKGQTLSAWAEQLQRNANPQEKEEAIAAIRTMCSDKTAMLAAWLDYDQWPRKNKLFAALRPLPRDWAWEIQTRLFPDYKERLADTATIALPVFGPELAQAIPHLTKVVNSTNDTIAERAFAIVGELGTNGLAILLPIAANTNNPRQFQALLAVVFMAHRPTNALPAILMLAKSTQSSNEHIVRMAADGLGLWKTAPDTSLHALLPLLSHPNMEVRASAIRAVGYFGETARSATPVLIKCLEDRYSEVQVEATNALHSINPERFTNQVSRSPSFF
jgi:hypothetical protein